MYVQTLPDFFRPDAWFRDGYVILDLWTVVEEETDQYGEQNFRHPQELIQTRLTALPTGGFDFEVEYSYDAEAIEPFFEKHDLALCQCVHVVAGGAGPLHLDTRFGDGPAGLIWGDNYVAGRYVSRVGDKFIATAFGRPGGYSVVLDNELSALYGTKLKNNEVIVGHIVQDGFSFNTFQLCKAGWVTNVCLAADGLTACAVVCQTDTNWRAYIIDLE